MHITHIKTDLYKEVIKIPFSKLLKCFILKGEEKNSISNK